MNANVFNNAYYAARIQQENVTILLNQRESNKNCRIKEYKYKKNTLQDIYSRKTFNVLQAHFEDIMCSVPDQHHKADTAIKQGTGIFWYPQCI